MGLKLRFELERNYTIRELADTMGCSQYRIRKILNEEFELDSFHEVIRESLEMHLEDMVVDEFGYLVMA